MSEAFDKVMDGLKDACAYLDSKLDGFVVHKVKVSELDVAANRIASRIAEVSG